MGLSGAEMKVWYWPSFDKIIVIGKYKKYFVVIADDKFLTMKKSPANLHWIEIGEL